MLWRNEDYGYKITVRILRVKFIKYNTGILIINKVDGFFAFVFCCRFFFFKMVFRYERDRLVI